MSGSKREKGAGILVAPILYYLPETRLAFGLAGNLVFRLGNTNGQDRPSTVSPIFVYTQNKQFKSQLSADIYFKQEDYHLIADLKFQRYPDKFFGIGSHMSKDAEEDFTSNTFALTLSFLKKIEQHMDIGIQYNFSKSKITDCEPGKLLVKGDIPGSRGSLLSGISLLVNLDSRDNIFFPRRGEWFKFNAQFYHPLIGSKFEFETYRLDLRKYFPLFSSHVLAIQSVVQIQSGEVPFQHLSMIGGQYVMRGYYEGRYRDKNLMVLQTEYRLPLFWRLGAVGFAAVGDVARRCRDFTLDNVKYSYGFGFRYLFNKAENMYVRFDVGFGKNSSAIYFSVFEAF